VPVFPVHRVLRRPPKPTDPNRFRATVLFDGLQQPLDMLDRSTHGLRYLKILLWNKRHGSSASNPVGSGSIVTSIGYVIPVAMGTKAPVPFRLKDRMRPLPKSAT